jgi:hypothetical protein
VNRPNETTPLTAKALIPLGALALAAGCGGGGGSPALPPQQPAANTPNAAKHAMTTAMLTIAIPARGPKAKSSAKRAPKYISQGSAAIGVTVVTAGAPAPAETVFPLPSPAPQATTTTLPVTAPLGTDTVSVNVYDAVPTATSTPNVLSKGTTTATIATGSTQLSVQALGVAAGVQLAAGTSSTWSVFQNHPQPQATTLAATPIDADGYAITGNLASPVPLTAPAGVTLSPATISAAGPVGATFAASQTGTGGTITAGLPLDTASSSTDNLTVAATQYLFVATEAQGGGSGTLSVIDPVLGAVVATVPLAITDPYPMAAIAGCASGETVVVASLNASAATTGVTLAPPSSGTAPVTTDLTGTVAHHAYAGSALSPNYLASDANCGLYSAADTALTRYSGFPNVIATPLSAPGWAANSSLAVDGSTLYGIGVVTTVGPPPMNFPTTSGTLQSVPVTGGTVATVGTVFSSPFSGSDFGMVVGGTNVYDLNTSCGTAYLSSVPSLNKVTVPNADFTVAPNGTIYSFTGSPTSPSSLRRVALARSAAQHADAAKKSPQIVALTPPPTVAMPGAAGAVTADGRFLAVGQNGSGGAASVQLYTIPAVQNASPSPLGTPIALPSAQPVVRQMAFPR